MFKTLHGKLSLVLLALFIPLGAFYVASTVATSRRYAQEVSQQVNADMAARLVREHGLTSVRDGDAEVLKNKLTTLAATYPDVDFYVLDATGKILQTSLGRQDLAARTVALEPIKAVMEASVAYPVLGDNPRKTNQPKVFSVAAIPAVGALEGYLYIVLADEVQDSVAAMVESSTILRLSIWVGLAGLTLVFLAAILIFTLLTRRLKRLATVMMNFEKRNFEGLTLRHDFTARADDEVGDLSRVFYNMASRITDQVSRLKESDRLRRDLVANVSHDLRTPLTALQGYIETLQLEDLSEDERRRYLDIAARHSNQLSNLTGELFELAKLEAKAVEVRKERFPLAELVQDVVQKFGLSAEKKGVTLVADVKVRPFVYADVGFLERVLENLIDNALRHTPPGGGVSVALTPVGHRVNVAVADTGSGIPASELPHVFERFYRASRTDGERAGGAGLGLTISQRLLELHDTQLQVASQVGVGTTFSYDLATA